ncbi:hypothetical protein CRE_09937 [Caenorhabditis remanei]|uniref:Uncharacterized protein n=1 Tax=Caenorhabditis remanei TaxID=31234 RepID=E3NTW1_CAERE|nr:hypothetical protein CRE_09937 [Caenorhabditis remanei]
MPDKKNLRSPENPAKQDWNSAESNKLLMERIRDLQHQEYSLQASITKSTGANYRKLMEEKNRVIEELKNKLDRERMDGEYYKQAYEALKAENEDKKNGISNENTYALFPNNQSKSQQAKTVEKAIKQLKREAFRNFASVAVPFLLFVYVFLLAFTLGLRHFFKSC